VRVIKNIIAFSCLCAIASVFYLTAYKMKTHLNLAAVASFSSPIIFHHPTNKSTESPIVTTSNPTQILTKTNANLPPDNTPTNIPDTALVDKNSKETSSSVEASYVYSLERLVENLHSRTNIARSQNNLIPLTYDSKLATLAEKRSEDMARNDYFSHTSPDGCDLSCRFSHTDYVTFVFGENLAEFSDYTSLSEPALAEMFVSKWLNSSGHRKNMLSTDFTHEGIGVAINNKRIVATVIFAKPS
jgi:uncharacterized protein YkwD